MDAMVSQAVEQSPLQQAIRAVQCLKGFREVGAATVCAELGEIGRFATPTELMSYTGLVPGVASSGNHTVLFGITKVGNSHLRHILTEAAWSYRTRPNVGRELARRQKGHPVEIINASWRAQTRLNGKYRRLIARGKHVNKAIVAVARELIGFVWEVLQLLPPVASQPAS
jgi:transposase